MKKKEIIQRLLIKESLNAKQDYIKQYSILNSLLKKYSSTKFWENFKVEDKVKSLYFFKTDQGKRIIEKKYKEFCQSPASQYNEYKLGRKSGGKVPYKSIIKKTTRRFLNE